MGVSAPLFLFSHYLRPMPSHDYLAWFAMRLKGNASVAILGFLHLLRATENHDNSLRKKFGPCSAPSYCPDQCWCIANCTLRNKLHWNSNHDANIWIPRSWLRVDFCKMAAILCRPRCVKLLDNNDYTVMRSQWVLIALTHSDLNKLAGVMLR